MKCKYIVVKRTADQSLWSKVATKDCQENHGGICAQKKHVTTTVVISLNAMAPLCAVGQRMIRYPYTSGYLDSY